MNVLTLNAGSSSLKYKVFETINQEVKALLSGLIEGIGESEGSWHHLKGEEKTISQHSFLSHEDAFSALAATLKKDLKNFPIQGVGHRVVHGGNDYYEPTVITDAVLKKIQELSRLAPIHNPINALGIQFAKHHFSEAIHIAIFDSGFHHSMAPQSRQYAIHAETADRYQIKRYGFHGINHEYVARQAAFFLKKPLANCNFISLHLGNGASACLIKNGQSFDTTMGMTPLAGLVMGTRCGDIDPAIVLYLQQQGMSAQEVDILLNKKSGLKGLANENDMRKLLERVKHNDEKAKLAIEIYCYAIQKTIGAYYSQTPNLDALIFTGGIGENAALIREKIIAPLKHLGFELTASPTANFGCYDLSTGKKPILVIRGDEEALIAEKVAYFKCN